MRNPDKKVAFGISMLVCWLLFSDALSAKETVAWRVTKWAPFYILEGSEKGKGLYDEMTTTVIKKMPEYNHVQQEMSTARVLREMKSGKKVCHPSVLPGTDATLSVLNSILLPHRLIMNNKKAGLFSGSAVSLNQLLGDSRYYGGITQGRYSTELNDIVKNFEEEKHLYDFPIYDNLIKMLFKGRVDYIIEYPPIVTYMAKMLELKKSTVSLKIQETSKTPYLLVYFACPKNDWGKQMIAKINKILIEESKNSDFLEFRLRWYDESSRTYLKKVYQEIYFNDK